MQYDYRDVPTWVKWCFSSDVCGSCNHAEECLCNIRATINQRHFRVILSNIHKSDCSLRHIFLHMFKHNCSSFCSGKKCQQFPNFCDMKLARKHQKHLPPPDCRHSDTPASSSSQALKHSGGCSILPVSSLAEEMMTNEPSNTTKFKQHISRSSLRPALHNYVPQTF